MSLQIFHGDIVYSKSRDEIVVNEDSYIVVKDGFVEGTYKTVPENTLMKKLLIMVKA